jgi:signal transduction histidine kinase
MLARAMNEFLRLLRVALILQCVLGLVTLDYDIGLPWIKAVAIAPAVITTVLLFAMASRISGNVRVSRAVLIAAMLAFVWQFSIEPVLLRALSGMSPAISVEYNRWLLATKEVEVNSLIVIAAGIGLLFGVLPALLGAWLDGRRSAAPWAIWVTFTSLLNALAFRYAMPASTLVGARIDEDIAWLIGQALLVGLMCYFVGALADRQRAEHAQLEMANVALAEANARLEAQAHVREHLAASRERLRLSRDLHDTLAHSLAALAVQLNGIKMIAPAESQVRTEIERAADLADDGLRNARDAIVALRADTANEQGLIAALRQRLDTLTRRRGIQTSLSAASVDDAAFAPDVAAALLGIAQEALNNAERHAEASRIRISLDRRRLCVRDDGVGITNEQLRQPGLGIRGMRERAELIGAALTIESRAGEGACVCVTLAGPAENHPERQ